MVAPKETPRRSNKSKSKPLKVLVDPMLKQKKDTMKQHFQEMQKIFQPKLPQKVVKGSSTLGDGRMLVKKA